MGPIGAVLMVVGAVTSAIGGIAKANAQANAQEANAQIAMVQAQEAQFAATESARLKRIQLTRLIGKQRAGYARGGVKITEGTSLLVEDETLEEGQRDIDLTIRAGAVESTILQHQAHQLRKSAKAGRQSAILGAFSTVLGGVTGSGILEGGGGGLTKQTFNKGFEATIRQPMGYT